MQAHHDPALQGSKRNSGRGLSFSLSSILSLSPRIPSKWSLQCTYIYTRRDARKSGRHADGAGRAAIGLTASPPRHVRPWDTTGNLLAPEQPHGESIQKSPTPLSFRAHIHASASVPPRPPPWRRGRRAAPLWRQAHGRPALDQPRVSQSAPAKATSQHECFTTARELNSLPQTPDRCGFKAVFLLRADEFLHRATATWCGVNRIPGAGCWHTILTCSSCHCQRGRRMGRPSRLPYTGTRQTSRPRPLRPVPPLVLTTIPGIAARLVLPERLRHRES
jgi:hypothetical protein